MKLKFFLLMIIFILINSTISFAETDIDISAEAGLLVEVSTGKILYEKNAYKKMYPASTTKILTAILVIENCNLETDIATVSESALSNIPTGYVTCNLQVGEKISVKDLLYALMIPSANDAAYVLAEHVGGTVEGFSDMMNKKAEEIGCTGTHFVNPNGIHDDDHYTTAHDLYLMANYAMKNETFREIVSITKYTLPVTNKYQLEDRVLSTTNDLLKTNSRYYYESAIGIKTGHTTQAGNCLVSESSKNGLDFISVILNGGVTDNGLNTRYTESIKLFDYGYSNYIFSNIVTQNTVITSIEVENASKDTKNLDLIIDTDINALHKKDLDISIITPEITLNEKILAPIIKGEKLRYFKI